MDIKKQDVNYTQTQKEVQWRYLLNSVTRLQLSIIGEEFLDQLSNPKILKKNFSSMELRSVMRRQGLIIFFRDSVANLI
jgi:hypothetical protein